LLGLNCMPTRKASKIIIDTNLWISFLIGKELGNLKDLIVSERVKLVTTHHLIQELKIVSSRPKFEKYFDQQKVAELISLLEIVSENVKINSIDQICRDPKDDFLLALSKKSKANYLVTSDRDLLSIRIYERTEILTVHDFKEKFK
jgi:putative PIN family toxin of toxin-antitoxin system